MSELKWPPGAEKYGFVGRLTWDARELTYTDWRGVDWHAMAGCLLAAELWERIACQGR